jgi:hypothetical protein
VLGVIRHRVHHSEYLHHPSHPVEIAKLLFEHREQVEADEAGVPRRFFGRHVGPHLALRDVAFGRDRHVARKE